MEKRVAPSTLLEEAIGALLESGTPAGEKLAEVGRLGARLVLQRAIDEEVTAFLQRARYERSPQARGSRNGVRPRRIQTAEGEVELAIPQLRDCAERFVPKIIPDTRVAIRTRPLEALIIGAYVRGLSDRDVESLIAEAGLGTISKSTVSRICKELRDRYKAFRARSLAEVDLLVLFMDAIYLPTRPSGAKEGVLVAWGYTRDGGRVLLDVCLGQRERHEDWLELGRHLTKRGLGAPALVVSDGAPGLIRAIEELWPDADRQRCAVHRLRNILAKLPKDPALHERVRAAYWAVLNEAELPPSRRGRPPDGGRRPGAQVPERRGLPGRRPAGADGPPRLSPPPPSQVAEHQPAGEIPGGGSAAGQGHRPLPGGASCLSLCWAVLDLVISGARGLGLTDLDRQLLVRRSAAKEDLTTQELIA